MKKSLINDKKFFYTATSIKALIEAWIQLKGEFGMLMLNFDNKTLQSISKHWFEMVSEKLRKGVMKYPKVRRIRIFKSSGKLGQIPLMINDPRIKIIEQAFLNAIEPCFEGIFEWIAITEKEYQKLVTDKSVYVKKLYDTGTNSTSFFKSKWILPKIFKDSNVGFRPNRSAHLALHKIKCWRTNIIFFLSCSIKKVFEKVHRNRLKNVFNSVIIDERFWIEIQKMFNAGFLKENLIYSENTYVSQRNILSPFLFNVYMHSFDEFIEHLNKPSKESYRKNKNSQYRDQEARKAYKCLQYKYGEGICHTLRKLGSKEALMKQRKMDYSKHYKIWSGVDKKNKLISYVRYADNFLIGITGLRKYALQVKQDVLNFLKSHLHLNIIKLNLVNRNESKILFLGHFIKLVKLKTKIRVQNKKIVAAQKLKTRFFHRLKVNDQRLARLLFWQVQKKTIKYLNNVSKLYCFKPITKCSIKITALSAAIECLKTIRENTFSNSLKQSYVAKNFAMDRFQKCNDDKIRLNEQVICYTLLEVIKSVMLVSQGEEFSDTAKKLFKEVKNLELNLEKIVKNVKTKQIDKKRQSLLNQYEKKELTQLAPDQVKAEVSSTTWVNIKVNADIKTIINRLRLKGFFHPLKDRPKSNSYLINFSDEEIIKNFNNVMMGLLNWFSGADNFYAVKRIVQVLRKSCALTLKVKHKYKSLHKVYTIYGFDIIIQSVSLCSRSFVWNKKKQFYPHNIEKSDHIFLWDL